MSTAKRSRPGWTTEAATKSMGTDTATVPKPADRFPQPRRIGCVHGCEGFGHDENCDLAVTARRLSPTATCSLAHRCKTMGISVLADPDYPTCPCSEAMAAHAGGVT